MKLPMLQNSKGKASASFTMLWIIFNIVALWMTLYVIGPMIGVTVPEFDGGGAMAVLSPLCATYFAGKWRRGIQEKETEES